MDKIVRVFFLDTVKNVVHLLKHRLVSVSNPDVWNVGSSHVVSRNSVPSVVGSQPMLLDLKPESIK